MQTLLSVAPFLEGLQDSHGTSLKESLREQLRQGLMRMHRFPGMNQAVFLGQENKLYMASMETNAEGVNQTKLSEVLQGNRPWQLTATRKHDVTAVRITGTKQEAFVLNHLLELFSVAQTSAAMTRLLPERKVIQVAGSDQHCLVLTTDGRVFSSGNNSHGQLGLGHNNTSPELQEVQLKLDSGAFRFATFVSCGANHSIVICEQESVHGFGANSNFRLGHTNDGNFNKPVRVATDQQIKKACCGQSHTLFLSSSGMVFGSGSGQRCQLGRNLRGSHGFQMITLPPVVQVPVADIFAHPQLDVSVLMDRQGVLYISGAAGQLYGHSNNIEDFFPLKEHSVVLDSRIVCMQPEIQGYQSRFDDPSCCDVQVCTADKSGAIYFGWDTIRARSPYLTNMIQSNMSDVSKTEGKWKVTLRNYQWQTHHAYGKYLHENVLDAEPETLLELLQLADEYEDETGLSSLCASMLLRSVTSDTLCECLERCIEIKFHALASDLIKQGLALSNVCDVLNVVAAAEERAKANARDEMADLVAYIKEICMAFAAQHASAVISDAKFPQLTPWVAKDLLSKLGALKLLKT